MADTIHETNGIETIPARPTLLEARNEAARLPEWTGGTGDQYQAAMLMLLMHQWADACDLNNRVWKPEDVYMLTPEELRQRLNDSGG